MNSHSIPVLSNDLLGTSRLVRIVGRFIVIACGIGKIVLNDRLAYRLWNIIYL